MFKINDIVTDKGAKSKYQYTIIKVYKAPTSSVDMVIIKTNNHEISPIGKLCEDVPFKFLSLVKPIVVGHHLTNIFK